MKSITILNIKVFRIVINNNIINYDIKYQYIFFCFIPIKEKCFAT